MFKYYLLSLAVGPLFIWLSSPSAAEDKVSLKFRQLTQQDGLSNNSVGFRGDSILRDKQGFVWVATQAGLNRFDGYRVRQFRKTSKKGGLSEDYLYGLFQDRNGFIWLAHHSGLDRFDPASEQFEQIATSEGKNDSSSYLAINQDAKGDIWATTSNTRIERYSAEGKFKAVYNPAEKSPLSFRRNISPAENGDMWFPFTGGVLRFDANETTFHIYTIKENDANSPVSVNAVYYDDNKRLWAGTQQGLYVLAPDDKQLRPAPDKNHSVSSPRQDIVDIVADEDAVGLWLLIRNQGLAFYSFSDQKTHFVQRKRHMEQLASTQIFDLYIDKSNFIWVGTNAGVSYSPVNQQDFHFQPNLVATDNKTEARPVLALLESRQRELWIGSFAGGLSRVRQDGSTQHFFQHEGTSVFALHQDPEDNLWVGTLQSGLLRFNATRSSFVRYPQGPKTITNIVEDADGDLWLGTQKEGLVHFSRKNQEFTFVDNDKIGKQGISSLLIDHENNLWVGTPHGLHYIDQKHKRQKYFHASSNDNPIIHDFVTALHEEAATGRLWIGTTGGLSVLEPASGEVISLARDGGLSGNAISAIQSDANGYLWLSTNNGLSVIDPRTLSIKNFGYADGLQETDFSQQAGISTKSGELIFGSATGYTRFDPLHLHSRAATPTLALTDFRLFNVSVPIATDNTTEGYHLGAAISFLDALALGYQESFFSLEFSAVDAPLPREVKYAYKLDGWDKNWINTDAGNRLASYTNIPAGDYVFRVRASDQSQRWQSESTPLTISISPPPWKSPTALTIYACLLLASVLLLIKLRTRHLERRSRELEQMVNARVEEISQQKHTIERLLKKKDEFFASVSHEFRTPLTLILGPLNQILRESPPPQLNRRLQPVVASGNRLLRMVDQLLDLSRFDRIGSQQEETICVADFAAEILAVFESAFQEKQLKINSDIPGDIFISISRDAFEKILANLVSNAIKYSPVGGKLDINVAHDDQLMTLALKDEGSGIAQEDHSRIFEHFVRLENPETRRLPGAGLGLALVKQLCETYGGTICLQSQPGNGTTFYLSFPLVSAQTELTEKAEEPIKGLASKQETINLYQSAPQQPEPSDRSESAGLPIVLIVEDHPDMQRYIGTTLSQEFNCIFADNGEQGKQKAMEVIPDLIITDLMMPKVDGFELAESLRDDEKTCHIPLIMLTARADIETRKYAWATDIDEFIEKPFDSDELALRCHNLLNIRKILSRRLGSAVNSTHQHNELSRLGERDRQFVEKLQGYLSLHYSDADLGAKTLCQALSMSESQLQRKIKAVLGQSVPEFIRGYRLKQSLDLLRAGKPITEVAYSVGFSNPTYFTKCFKAEFGETPSAHQKVLEADE